MSAPAERRLIRLDGSELPPRAVIGGKAWSLAHMATRGLPVPPAVVITTAACRDYLRDGALPEGLIDEIRDGVAWLEQATGRRFGAGPRPLLMSVRSGAPVSMPGMMDTVLNLGIDDTTEAALAADCGDADFARDTHRRFLELYARVVLKATPPALDPGDTPAQWRAAIDAAAEAVPRTPEALLLGAVEAVFDSWRSRRAQRYRRHHGIDDDLGTAVTLQAMVFGNMGADSGTGVLFSRNPLSGEPEPYGEYLACAQGEDVVSGSHTPQSLDALAASAPAVHAALLAAAETLEATAGDVQDIEFTVERGRLFLLQARIAKRSAQAAVRTAVDLCREGRIDTAEALHRVTPTQVHTLLSPRLAPDAADDAASLLHGEAASPGVGSGVVVTDSDEAERRAAAGEAVVLVRPSTSPDDLHGMLAARAVVTELGGGTSHAAVVGRALGVPCVVGCGTGACEQLAGRTVTVDGGAGRVYDGALSVVVPHEDDEAALAELLAWARTASPLRVLAPHEMPAEARVADLAGIEGGADPDAVATALAGLADRFDGARGGAIASEAGVAAAMRAGLAFIVAEPRLPALLAAIHVTEPAPVESATA